MKLTLPGLPDYRSKGVGMYARSTSRPVQFPDFVKSAAVRQNYWARNFVAWPRFSVFQPNVVHQTLARFEREGRMIGLVTQNVDTLHTKAGHKNLIEIHGNGYKVICLECKLSMDRHEFQHMLTTLNPDPINTSEVLRPDGDIELPKGYAERFQVPKCPDCGADKLKPDIVFFGDNVPMSRIEEIVRWNCRSDGLLVLGSSLSVFSGYRLVLQTKELGLPVAIVTIGETRGDPKADLKISAKCGDIIPKLFQKR